MVDYNKPPASSKFFQGELYQAMLEDLQLAGKSKRTVHGYLRAVRQLADGASTQPADNLKPVRRDGRAISAASKKSQAGHLKQIPRQ